MTLLDVLRTAGNGNWRWASDAVGDRGTPARALWDLLEAKGAIVFEGPFYKLSNFGHRMLRTLEDVEKVIQDGTPSGM